MAVCYFSIPTINKEDWIQFGDTKEEENQESQLFREIRITKLTNDGKDYSCYYLYSDKDKTDLKEIIPIISLHQHY